MRKTSNTERSIDTLKDSSETSTELALDEHAYKAQLTYRNPKERLRVIKNIERIVRTSLEYKIYLHYLRTQLNAHGCAFLKNIDLNNESISKDVTVEAHHFPFTLFDITLIVLSKYEFLDNINQSKDETTGDFKVTSKTSFEIADEIMALHYKFLIGIVPLSKTVHELAHSGKIQIFLNQVYGDVDKFIAEYRAFIPEEYLESYSNLQYFTRQHISNPTGIPPSLVTNITIYDIDGVGSFDSLLPTLANKNKLTTKANKGKS